MLERRDFRTSEEMLTLFARGLQLVAQGHSEPSYDRPDSDQYGEFLVLRKRLEWGLLELPLHAASVFDPEVEGPVPDDQGPPERMLFQDWELVQMWRKALLDALDARNKRPADPAS